MKKKKIFLFFIGFCFIFLIFLGWRIHTRMGWSNFRMHMENLGNSLFIKKESNEINLKTDTVTAITKGYTIADQFENEEELLNNADQKLYNYYKLPLTEEFKELKKEQVVDHLKKAIKIPRNDQVQQAFITYTKGSITDFEERGLQMKIGTCYENNVSDNTAGYSVTCNVIAFGPNKDDLVKTISILNKSSYHFYFDNNSIEKWSVTESDLNIPFDYSLYEEYNQYLEESGIKIDQR